MKDLIFWALMMVLYSGTFLLHLGLLWHNRERLDLLHPSARYPVVFWVLSYLYTVWCGIIKFFLT